MSSHSKQVSRRDFLKMLGVGAASLGASGAIGTRGLPFGSFGVRPQATPINLDFVVWSYSVDTIQDNIKQFQQKYPDIQVTLSDFAWNQYRETMINRLSSNTPTDVMYSGGDWLPEWAKAGWLVPLEDYFPKVKEYVPKIAPYAVKDMTYEGKLYGMPYYADTTSFLYNAKILKDNGIDKPPATWEEVSEQSRALQKKGIESPFLLEMAQDLPTTLEDFIAMVFGRGGELLDENMDPILDKADGAAFKQAEWLAQGVKDKTIMILPHETDIVKAMNTGKHVFTVLYNYNLAELNNKATSPLAGQFQLAIMPGGSGETYGFAKFYSMTKMAADRGKEVQDACWKYIEYSGGETDGQYVIAKRWAVEKGLGFGQLPLFDDKDVQKSFSEWVDVDLLKQQVSSARARRQPAWYGIWAEFVRLQLIRAVNGEIPVAEAFTASAEKARELKKQFA
jgi:multiple sugar transport system substrate-binding protein